MQLISKTQFLNACVNEIQISFPLKNVTVVNKKWSHAFIFEEKLLLGFMCQINVANRSFPDWEGSKAAKIFLNCFFVLFILVQFMAK